MFSRRQLFIQSRVRRGDYFPRTAVENAVVALWIHVAIQPPSQPLLHLARLFSPLMRSFPFLHIKVFYFRAKVSQRLNKNKEGKKRNLGELQKSHGASASRPTAARMLPPH